MDAWRGLFQGAECRSRSRMYMENIWELHETSQFDWDGFYFSVLDIWRRSFPDRQGCVECSYMYLSDFLTISHVVFQRSGWWTIPKAMLILREWRRYTIFIKLSHPRSVPPTVGGRQWRIYPGLCKWGNRQASVSLSSVSKTSAESYKAWTTQATISGPFMEVERSQEIIRRSYFSTPPLHHKPFQVLSSFFWEQEK